MPVGQDTGHASGLTNPRLEKQLGVSVECFGLSFITLDEPPSADLHATWCGEGVLEIRPYPISGHMLHSRENTLLLG